MQIELVVKIERRKAATDRHQQSSHDEKSVIETHENPGEV
jgi:hypothetical protein